VPPDWQQTRFVLDQFAASAGRPWQHHSAFVADRLCEGRRRDLRGGGLRRSRAGCKFTDRLLGGREHWASDERVLGPSEFVQRMLDQPPTPTPPLAADPEAVMPTLIHTVAHHFDLAIPEIIGNFHRPCVVTARAVVSYLAMHNHGLAPAELGVCRFRVVRGFQRAQQIGIDADASFAGLLR